MELLAKERTKTLGTVFREAHTGGLVEGDIADAFRLLIEERNWLIHRSLHDCNDGLHRAMERQAFLKRLADLTDEAIRLKKELYAEATRWCASHGVDVARAEILGLDRFMRLRN
jgi:hypothetical protein